MLTVAVALLLSTLHVPAIAEGPDLVSATNAETASGFKDLADCENAIGGFNQPSANALADKGSTRRGSLFNLAAGNVSRCEIVAGEPLIVVYPRARGEKRQAR